MIRTEGLTKRFGHVLAVDRLTLEVHPGEVFGFLGPNGAGKTTTVRMLACLIAPTSGRAWVNGHEVGRDDATIRSSVGILTETPGLYDKLDAEQNLRLFAELYGVEDAAAQVRKYLSLLGLWERRHEPVATFSKGMRQKMAIARAMLHEPPLIFLDEPTAALDPEAARLVRDFIEELSQEGRTFFICTHNLDEADRLCDRIAVIRQRLVRVDSPQGLRRSLYGQQVVVRLRQVFPTLVQAVEGLDFVQGVHQEDNSLVISLSDPEAQNPLLIRRLLEAGGEIQFVEKREHTLEQVYFDLMREEQESAT
ncbi:MAG: ABC transporter ATP-binding protein [Anaerolineae bacterium]